MHPSTFITVMQNPQVLFTSSFYGPFTAIVVVLAILEVALKGLGLWRAARMGKTGWFVALLLINTAGILPFIYLLLTKKEYEHYLRGEKMIG